ncbi:MAG: AI-2E family transporter [Rickettsiales bacterium]|nr:AI-2E family transporter [Rickettsiales bacterium]
MTLKEKLALWIGATAFLFLFLYSVRSILLPFVVALITAYFLDPATDKLEKSGLSRFMSTMIITVIFFAVTISGSLLIMPLIYEQLLSLVDKIPEYTRKVQSELLPYFSSIVNKIDPNAAESLQDSVKDVSKYALRILGDILSKIWDSGVALLNLLSLLFITPIVTFYVLKDWDVMMDKIASWLPKKHKDVILEQMRLVDITLSGYIRGQTNVCLLLGTFYAIGLMMVGLDFGLVIGLATGLLSFIPYVGLLVGMSIGLIVAFVQFGGFEGLTSIAIVASIFIIGQVIEGNFVSPKLVGDKVGLHPVWIMFGMLAGAALFGFVGVLISVPVTAVIGVLMRFMLSKYLDSSLYLDKKSKKAKT